MGLPVAVEIAPPAPQREQVTALLSACSRAVAESDCVLAGEGAPGGTMAVAIVTWESPTHVLVEVGLRQGGSPQWRTRTLDFNAKDSPLERWRTVGFVVGILARGDVLPDETTPPATEAKPVESSQEQPAPAASPDPPETAKPRAARSSKTADPPEPERSSSFSPPSRGVARARIDLGVTAGNGIEQLKGGVIFRSHWPLWGRLRSVASLQYTVFQQLSPDYQLSARWLTLATGVGGAFGSETLQAIVGLDARAEHVNMTAERDGLAGETLRQGSGRWLMGSAAHTSFAWLPILPFGLFVSGELAWMAGATEVRVLRQAVASDSPWRVQMQTGVCIRLW